MATNTSGISFSGLFSNIDTDSMISKLMSLERAPVNLLEKKSTKLGFQKDDILNVNNSLLTLKGTLSALTTSATLFDNTVTSSDSSIVTGTADSSATSGSYNVEVLNLASEQIAASGSKLSTYVYSGGGGTFEIMTENKLGPKFDINVANNDTLSMIAAKINASTDTLGTSDFSDYGFAQVITDPTTGNQTLTIKTNETGTANQFFYKTLAGATDPLLKLGLITYDGRPAGTPNGPAGTPVNGIDATVKINGVTVTSSNNSMTGAITGVTLNLLSADPGTTVKVDIGVSNAAISTAVKAFVDQFNSVTSQINGYVKEKPLASPKSNDELKVGDLFGDSDLITMKSGIRLKTTGYSDQAQSTYKILAQIGINSESSAGSFVSDKLEYDEAKLTAAIAADKDEVISLLNGWADQMNTYLDSQTKVSVIQSDAGNFYRRVLSIEDKISGIGEDIDNWNTRLQSMEDRMRVQFAEMESALQSMQSQSSYLTSQLSNLSKANSSK